MCSSIRIGTVILAAALARTGFAADVAIQVDAGKKGVPIGKELYGVFLEEIGHGVDGGLYGEMLQNRAFEDAKPPEGFTYQQGGGRRGSGFRGADSAGGKWVNPGGYATTFVFAADKALPYWSLVQRSGGQGTMSLDMADPLTPATPRSCKLDVTQTGEFGRVGIANEGYWGIGIKNGETYNISFWAKAGPNFHGRVMATLENGDNIEVDQAFTANVGDPGWKQFSGTLVANRSDPQAKLVLATSDKGTLWFDMMSLMPAKTFKSRPNGMRQDIAQMIADMKPGFVRFPGGCVVEAATVETTYNWKNTLGKLEDRSESWNAWDYRRTSGVGMYEYLQFIEDIGATPLYVGFAGQTCVYRAPAVVPMDQMKPYVDNFVDLVDYANGPATSKWGKLRADSGHPAPFGLHMMEIGNENDGQVYTERYAMIYQALKAAHPEVSTIADLPVRGQPVEMIDDHHYADPNYFINTTFDSRPRTQPPLYLGEVADTAPPQAQRGNLQCALAEGTYLMNAEKNADVVKMISYAPLLGHVNGLTELAGSPPPWHAMIYFDSTRIYGTASYYLWKTFGVNRPSVNLQTRVATSDAKNSIVGNVGVGTWGTSAEFKDVKVENDGKTLYASDFATGTQGWTTEAGRWSVVDGAYRQSQNTNGFAYVGDPAWTDYTFTMKARKIAGGEGFLIIFGHKGGDRYWWNVGGWGNTRHEVELNQAVQGNIVNGQKLIETNRWYDVKIVVKGLNVQCFLDGQLVHNIQAAVPSGPISAIAGLDETTNEVVVKVINRGPQPMTATVDLAGFTGLAAVGKLTTLSSGGLNDNNSLANPTAIVPVESDLPVPGPKFDHAFPAYSLSVLRVKAAAAK